MRTLKLTVLALSFVLGLTIAAYAGKATEEGDIDELDLEFDLECEKVGTTCVTIRPNKESTAVLEVEIACEGGDPVVGTAKGPGKKAKACVKDCDAATGFLRCDSGDCDNGTWTAKGKCNGDVEDFQLWPIIHESRLDPTLLYSNLSLFEG